jgi:1,4-dihydroxy-2-naphthoate octaprenyltransferase
MGGTQLGLLASVLIAINNLRDRVNDAKANKRTLSVRLGEKNSKIEIGALVFVPFVINMIWLSKGWVWPVVLPLVLLPLAFKLMRDVRATEPGRVYNQFLARAAKIHMGFGVLLSVGLWVSRCA